MTIRVGFLGAGLIAAYHAIELNQARDAAAAGADVPDNRIVAVYDPDSTRAQALAAGQAAVACASPQEVIDASDAVFVCTWTAAHLPMVRLVAEAGLPLFCEKPLSLDLISSRDLVAEVRRAQLVNMVGLVMRSSPTLLVMREMIGDPAVGRVMNVVFRDDQYLPTQGMYGSTWRGDVELAGAGALMEHSIHDLDLLEWLFGPVDSIGAQQSFFHSIDGIEDSVSALLRFSSGATGSLASIWHDVMSRPSQRRMEVFCERATVTLVSDDAGPVVCQTSEGEESVAGEEMVPWLAVRGIATPSAETEFLRAVQIHLDGGVPGRLRPDVEDALRAHILTDATYRSAAVGGDPVAVPHP